MIDKGERAGGGVGGGSGPAQLTSIMKDPLSVGGTSKRISSPACSHVEHRY